MTPEEFTSDMNVRPELIGGPVLMMPFLQKVSTQRGAMFSSHATQAMVVDGAEVPYVMSGFEPKYGKYELNPSSRDQDVQIKEIVPKFKSNTGRGLAIHNPTLTVIYLGGDDNKIGYVDIPSYTELGNGFGYINKRLNRHMLIKDNYVTKDVDFITSPNHDGDMYNLGVNANVCYIPDWGVADDAFVISDRLQKKLEHTIVNSVSLNLRIDDVPLNLYGDENDYKIFPDLGEVVRDDGCIIALRTHNASSLLTDITAESLRTLEPLHDEMHVAPPGAEIIDVQIFVNQKKYPTLLKDELYTQIMQYQEQHTAYYETIVNIYRNYAKQGYKFSPEFTNLVTRSEMLCHTRSGRRMVLMNKKEPVDYINIKITWAMKRKVDKGFKLTDRAGSKGVVSDIRPLADMPTTADGVVADILISGESPANRLNDGQQTESFIGYVNEVICNRIKNNPSVEENYEYVLNYINHVRPVYAKFLRDTTSQNKAEFVDAIKQSGLYLIIPPFCKNISPEMVSNIAKNFQIERQIITYAAYDAEGNRVIHELEDKGIIGSKYVYLLGKIPIDSLNSIEYGYTSQFGLPIKPTAKSIKTQSLIGSTPCRYGEDETLILCLSVDPMVVKRMYGIYATSPVAVSAMQYELLTNPTPTNIDHIPMTTQEIIDTDVSISLFKHMLAEIGYELIQH